QRCDGRGVLRPRWSDGALGRDQGHDDGPRGRSRDQHAVLPRSAGGRTTRSSEHHHHLRHGEDDGRPFIVMELVQGWTLNKYLERPEAAHIEKKIDLMLQICAGLHAAHTHGIFHRDVKPGNLLVGQHGELKIVDFGIARLASSSMTASGLIVGTPDYMSPEQARGPDVDQRSDIFSAGAVFYLMLTGRKPFAGPDPISVLAKVQAESPLPIRDSESPAPL